MNSDERTRRLLREIDATDLLATRPRRSPNWQLEAETLATLADIFSSAPEQLPQALAHAAIALTGAQAAGISLDEPDSTPRVFRWIATAGTYACYANQTMPWEFSPCGEVLRRNRAILMRDMRTLYEYVDCLHEPPREVLLVPFEHDKRPVGTLWVVCHDDQRPFDLEHLRLLQTLTRFAGAGVHNTHLVRQLATVNARQADELASRLEHDQQKDRFIAILAHEMRTPLTSIALAVQIMKVSACDEEQRESALSTLERQTTQLATLARDMTDVVAIRAGKISLSLTTVVLQEVVASAVEACREQVQAKQHALEIDVPETPALVCGDIVRLTQVLINLLTNAVRYTPAPGRIEIRLLRQQSSVYCLSVSDTGIGIDRAEAAEVFDMYAQLPAPRILGDTGLGIGLALVKQLVELHDGRVLVDSPGRNQGSTFTVILPAYRGETAFSEDQRDSC